MLPAEKFDVFMCYRSQDRRFVLSVNERLKAYGVTAWLDVEQLRPGIPWQSVMDEQLNTISSAAVFVGRGAPGPWQSFEVASFLRQFIARGCPVIPVILPGVKDLGEVPTFLTSLTWVDFRRRQPDPLKQLLWGITGRREGRPQHGRSTPDACSPVERKGPTATRINQETVARRT